MFRFGAMCSEEYRCPGLIRISAAGALKSETNSVLGAKGREEFPLRHVLKSGTFLWLCLGLTHASEWGAMVGDLAPSVRKLVCVRRLGPRICSHLAPMYSEGFSVLGALESRISLRGAPWTQQFSVIGALDPESVWASGP